MQLKSISDDLRHYLHASWHHDRMREADLNRLIEALEKKAVDLQRRLDLERNPLKRRHLKIELRVARMQHDKGVKRLNELRDDGTSTYAPPHRSTVADVTD